MSEALYGAGGLRFWSEEEIEVREMIIGRLKRVIQDTLTEMNPAWRFYRCDTPTLVPIKHIPEEYDAEDIFITNGEFERQPLAMRAETTHGSYTYLRHLFPQKLNKKLPACVWQSGISYRQEASDGATGSKMRFNAFYQLEFQCVYSVGTMADYRKAVMEAATKEIGRLTGRDTKIIESDRLPKYSESTMDIECYAGEGFTTWGYREVASCSIRNDFSDDTKVAEFAFGLDRLVEMVLRDENNPL